VRASCSGHWTRERDLSGGDFRGFSPRFQGENLDHNLRLVEELRAVAEEAGATPAQAAIAWALNRGSDIVPLLGARRRERLQEALGALELDLDLDRIEAAIPAGAAAGDRYPDMHGIPA
jgi:aryl-alcohol dehydrogenase-like predicted oxidoreductase